MTSIPRGLKSDITYLLLSFFENLVLKIQGHASIQFYFMHTGSGAASISARRVLSASSSCSSSASTSISSIRPSASASKSSHTVPVGRYFWIHNNAASSSKPSIVREVLCSCTYNKWRVRRLIWSLSLCKNLLLCVHPRLQRQRPWTGNREGGEHGARTTPDAASLVVETSLVLVLVSDISKPNDLSDPMLVRIFLSNPRKDILLGLPFHSPLRATEVWQAVGNASPQRIHPTNTLTILNTKQLSNHRMSW